MFKKSKFLCLIAGIFMGLIPLATSSSYVYANETYKQSLNETQKVVDEQLKKMENMTLEEKEAEVNRLLKQYDGMTVTLYTSGNPILRNAQPSTGIKVINGGMNFFAYNKAGINKLANLFGQLSFAEGASGGASGMAAIIAGALGVATAATAGLAAIIAAMGAYAFQQFADANKVMREHEKAGHSKAGVRITFTEVLDITNMGINAYG
ncbi:hypothetical protein [Enterococcus crotali]|uniref:hypothetical protein n=1 Tax=Enterococcus crotali TaxID=1453587 RepID=UPI0004704294|nr:hypothetical protein [Enterococcus crotali]